MKTVLLAICGLTPQVITETLYALHQQGRLPDAIRILTTREGKDRCSAQLLAGGEGAYYQLLADYGIDRHRIDFSPRHIRAVADEHGRELDDIGSEDDNELFLRACMEEAFALTSVPETTVFFSVAGGRKTMGACLAVAAQCYGRPQDRLFHVLVAPEFESSREFFFPPSPPREVELRDQAGQPYRKSTRFAKVSLIPMPFIPVRERLPGSRLRQPETPADLMLSLVREKRPELIIDLTARKVVWKGVECDMMPARLALYAFFALRKKEQVCESGACHGCDQCFLSTPELLDQAERVADLYRRIAAGREFVEMSDTGVMSLSAENFNSYKAKIRKELERAFGGQAADELEIASRGRRPGVRYGIALDRERIRVVL